MPPGVRPFKPVADSAKVDFVQQLIRSREPKKGLLQTWVTDPAKNVGNMAKGLVNSAVATPIDALDWAGQQVTKYVGGVEPKDTFDPASVGGTNLVGETWRGLNQASNRAAGDIAAIPGVGKPSASPTAADVRKYGVTEGLARAGMDYGNLAAAAYPAAKAGITTAQTALAERAALAAAEPAVARTMSYDDLLRFARLGRTSGMKPANYTPELQALSDYLGDNFPQYQNYLRGFDNSLAARDRSSILTRNVDSIDRLFENAYGLQRPTILYRGIKGGPNTQRQAYVNQLMNAKVGDIISEPGFMSTTTDLEIAQGFARNDQGVVLEITAPQGTKVVSPLYLRDTTPLYVDAENELTLPRNTQLRITGRQGNVIRAEVVPATTPAVAPQPKGLLADAMARFRAGTDVGAMSFGGDDAARASADELARMMAEKNKTPALPDRPIIQMKPTAPPLNEGIRMNPDGSFTIMTDTGEQVLRPAPPSTERPSWMPLPEPKLSDAEVQKFFDYEAWKQSPPEFPFSKTPEELTRLYELYQRPSKFSKKTVNPATTNVDWSTVDPINDVDWTTVFWDPMDAQIANPEVGVIYEAQKAAKDGLNDFLVRNGLQSKLLLSAPGVDLRRLPRYIDRAGWPTLMEKVPELKNYYVDVMRSYGIGL